MEFIRHLGESGRPLSVVLASAHTRSLAGSVEAMARAYGVSVIGAIEKPVTAAKIAAVLARYAPPAAVADTAMAMPSLEEAAAGMAGGEFLAYFQPKVDLHDDRFRGAEAVARWRHPARGLLPPSQFVPLLDSAPHVDELTRLMLRQAALVCRQWRSAGVDATVSVNVSLASLNDLDVADRLNEVVHAQGILPREAVLEVTETAAASNLGRVLENLSRLRMKGFGLASDDCGTGYGSMEQLPRIRFSELKIDRSFVARAATDRASRAVLESSLEIARKLGIASVAEGIETQEQALLLRSLGCDLGQGYFFGAPMPAEELWRWIQGRHAHDRTRGRG
jgi:EAL domain-containing protein (putative c-di-GMP-specific phosphodiesterase class I)